MYWKSTNFFFFFWKFLSNIEQRKNRMKATKKERGWRRIYWRTETLIVGLWWLLSLLRMLRSILPSFLMMVMMMSSSRESSRIIIYFRFRISNLSDVYSNHKLSNRFGIWMSETPTDEKLSNWNIRFSLS